MPEPAIGSESTEWGTEGGIVDPRSIDEYPIENSRNLVRSGGVFDAIQAGGGSGYPRTDELDFSLWDDGYFQETLDSGDVLTYLVQFDSGGNPVGITESDGHVVAVVW